jgi:hypothetical protein
MLFHDFVDEVFRWALVNYKPEILLDTLPATNRDLYSIISILLTLSVSSTTSEISLSGRRLVKSYLLQIILFLFDNTTTNYLEL